jgi:hypothetical protein
MKSYRLEESDNLLDLLKNLFDAEMCVVCFYYNDTEVDIVIREFDHIANVGIYIDTHGALQ